MNERDRLIELLRAEIPTECDDHEDCIGCPYEFDVEGCFKALAVSTADYLLANGVIVPPCKVGQTVYTVECCEIYAGTVIGIESFETEDGTEKTYHAEDDGYPIGFTDEDFGKTVFLTREEAEQALKEREQP